MIKFNYGQNLLFTRNGSYCLDHVREYLLRVAENLCSAHKIKTILRAGVSVTNTTQQIDGRQFYKKEISLSGRYVITYDWDTIFFIAGKTGLLQIFIDEHTTNRTGRPETTAV